MTRLPMPFSPAVPRGRRMLAIGATAALVGAGVLCTAAPASAAQTVSATYSFTGATETWTVPAGVSSIDFIVTGGAGGAASGPDGGAGGLGGSVSGTIAVTAGQTVEFSVGGQGGVGGDNDAPGAGGWGYSSGGAGGPGSITTLGLAGAGGGGATAIVIDGTVVAVAGGGGGGGGRGHEAGEVDLGFFTVSVDACPGGAGGAADAAGSSAPGESSDLCFHNGSGGAAGSTAGVGGTGGTGFATAAQGGGGGGGGGYATGGSGGAGSSVLLASSGGGGGAGGTSYDSTGSATIGLAGAAGDGSILLSYQLSYATATSLSITTNPALVGQDVTYSVAVTNSTDAAIVPAGTVTIVSGATVLGTVTLDAAGGASLTSSVLPVGSHPLTATFAPAASTAFEASTGTANLVVGKGDTTTTLVQAPVSATFGDTVTLQATVSVLAPADAPLTGTVDFLVDAVPVGTAAVDPSGMASVSWTPLSGGAHLVSAMYSGSADLNASSGVLSADVLKAATTTTVSIGTPSTTLGTAVELHASVASTAGSPTGFVQFFANGSPVGSPVAVEPDGSAALTTAALPLGSVAVTAQYLGDADFEGSLSAVAAHEVTMPTAALASTGADSGAALPLGALALVLLGVAVLDLARRRSKAMAAKPL